MTPEFIADAIDDLRDCTPTPPRFPPGATGFKPPPIVVLAQRLRGIGDPAWVGGLGLDMGFLLAAHEGAPKLFGDLLAWRLGGSLAQHHATGTMQPVAKDQGAARCNRRHREYRDGLRVRGVGQ